MQLQSRRRAERISTRAWHLWNVPTASDVARLREQLASVERRLRGSSRRGRWEDISAVGVAEAVS